MNKTLRKAISTYLLKTNTGVVEEKILIGSIAYKHINKILNLDNGSTNTIWSMAEEHVKLFTNTVVGMRNTYVSYIVAMLKIKKYNIGDFLQITDKEIDELYSLYLDKTKIEPFSCIKYSPNIYSIINISWNENERLSFIHFNVMVPLIQYYKQNKGIKDSDVKIYTGEIFEGAPGKGILFSITGIPTSVILADIKRPSLGISNYIYKTDSYDGNVLIIMK